ncbi:MAG TPA: hypothetical protein VJ020_06015, partial [Anaerolineales bacterium]|nr:hypothetical protein [Anaerolineales bacterium]
WLMGQQLGDGSWDNDQGLVHEDSWRNLQNDHLPVTAYIVWSLYDARYGYDTRAQRGLAYVRAHASEADDPYVLALTANALVAADKATTITSPETEAALSRLAEMAVHDGEGMSWLSSVATYMGSTGRTGSIETTALAALAFIRADVHADLANSALTTLVKEKDSFGTWYTTQATVLALKALIQSARAGGEYASAVITVALNGSQSHTIQITPENFDVVQMITFDDLSTEENTITIDAVGQGSLMYQVSGSYYLPWASGGVSAGETAPVKINLAYDRTELSVNDTVAVNVSVELTGAAHADSALIDLGLPPGFTVEAQDLNALVEQSNNAPQDGSIATIARYELTGRQILVYVENLNGGQPLNFSYRLRAKFPLVAQTPASNAYDYYNPDVSGEAAPLLISVAP